MSDFSRNLKEKMVLDFACSAVLARIARHYAEAHSVIGDYLPRSSIGDSEVLEPLLAKHRKT